MRLACLVQCPACKGPTPRNEWRYLGKVYRDGEGWLRLLKHRCGRRVAVDKPSGGTLALGSTSGEVLR